MTNEEELMSRSGCDDVPMPCVNCDHDAHSGRVCEYEPGDRWVVGYQASEPTVLMAFPPCGCTNYEPMEAGDILEWEHTEEV